MSAIRSSDAVNSQRPDVSSGLQGAGTSSPSGAATEQLDVPEPRGGGGAPRLRFLAEWPLLAVLLVQAALSLRLVRADTAYQSEAAALWSGHLEWAHWLHGAPIPPFPAFFSAAPVLYPPLGAAADSIGGLTGARILSLVFMLAATVLLWGAAKRLFGRRAAFFAAALFAALGPTLHLGAFATYDALSVLLIAAASWCVIRAAEHGTWGLVAGGAFLALANATSYGTVVFDPFVAALALLIAIQACGGLVAVRRAATLLLVTAALLTAGLLIGGSTYRLGVQHTVLSQVPGSASPQQVFAHSWYWAGLLVVLAGCGIIISVASRQDAARTWLLVVLTAAVVAGPLNQARLHTAATLDKHLGLGAWFAAIAAGYAVDRFIAAAPAGRSRALTCGACVIALVFPAALAASQSQELSTSWPNATAFITLFGPLADRGTGHLLVEDAPIAKYYLPSGAQWQRWSSTRTINLPSGTSTGGPAASASVTSPGNAAVYANYIATGYFSVVALNYTDTTALDHSITADMRRNHHYRIVQVIPYGVEVPPIGLGTYVIWRYQPHPNTAG